jgi:hypothetical protein
MNSLTSGLVSSKVIRVASDVDGQEECSRKNPDFFPELMPLKRLSSDSSETAERMRMPEYTGF